MRLTTVAAFIFIAIAPAVVAAPDASPAAPQVTTVILVRHAEKGPSDGTMAADPALSAAGAARAEELVRVLAGAHVSAIYVTPYERTRKTAAPLAARLGLRPVELVAGKEYASQVAALVRAEHGGQTVLIVGHSNTTPAVIAQLGIADPPVIPESEYDNLFVVTLSGCAPPRLLALRYGAR